MSMTLCSEFRRKAVPRPYSVDADPCSRTGPAMAAAVAFRRAARGQGRLCYRLRCEVPVSGDFRRPGACAYAGSREVCAGFISEILRQGQRIHSCGAGICLWKGRGALGASLLAKNWTTCGSSAPRILSAESVSRAAQPKHSKTRWWRKQCVGRTKHLSTLTLDGLLSTTSEPA